MNFISRFIALRYLKRREVQGLEVTWQRQPLTGQQEGKEINQKGVAMAKCKERMPRNM